MNQYSYNDVNFNQYPYMMNLEMDDEYNTNNINDKIKK